MNLCDWICRKNERLATFKTRFNPSFSTEGNASSCQKYHSCSFHLMCLILWRDFPFLIFVRVQCQFSFDVCVLNVTLISFAIEYYIVDENDCAICIPPKSVIDHRWRVSCQEELFTIPGNEVSARFLAHSTRWYVDSIFVRNHTILNADA